MRNVESMLKLVPSCLSSVPYRTTELQCTGCQSIGLLQLAICVAGSLLNWSGQCIGTVAGGQCQTGQGRYDRAVRCGCVVHRGGRKTERERESATPSKPSHRLLHNGAKKMNVYCKNERKVNGNCIQVWLKILT